MIDQHNQIQELSSNGMAMCRIFLLLDYNSMKPAAIAEVFGFYTDEYKEKAKEKIAFFSSLDKYDFVYWRKYNGDSIPIWKLKDIQNKLRKK